jgi:hypothetical protein
MGFVQFDVFVIHFCIKWHFIEEEILLEEILQQEFNVYFHIFDQFAFIELVLDGLLVLDEVLPQIKPQHKIKPPLINPLPLYNPLLSRVDQIMRKVHNGRRGLFFQVPDFILSQANVTDYFFRFSWSRQYDSSL